MQPLPLRIAIQPSIGPPMRKWLAAHIAGNYATQRQKAHLGYEHHSPDPEAITKNIEETKAFIQLCHDIDGSGVKVRPHDLSADVPAEKTLRQIGPSLNEVAQKKDLGTIDEHLKPWRNYPQRIGFTPWPMPLETAT